MRTRFRRRRRRATWSFADSSIMNLNNGAGGPGGQAIAWVWVLPPARAQYLMETRNRDSITFAGAHLWLDFWWQNGSSGALALPDVDFGVIKTTIADITAFTPDLSMITGQWDQPSTPATLTSWEEDDDDGTGGFLWSHHIKGSSPPNAMVVTVSGGIAPENQTFTLGNGTIDTPTHMCRTFSVRQEWQPDVVIRSKRRLKKGEGILLFSVADRPSVPAGLDAITQVKLRALTS